VKNCPRIGILSSLSANQESKGFPLSQSSLIFAIPPKKYGTPICIRKSQSGHAGTKSVRIFLFHQESKESAL